MCWSVTTGQGKPVAAEHPHGRAAGPIRRTHGTTAGALSGYHGGPLHEELCRLEETVTHDETDEDDDPSA